MTYPWEQLPAVQPEISTPAEQTVEDLVTALRRDFAFAVRYTAVVVHSNNPAFVVTVNTERGQIIPRGPVKFADGTTVELQDMGMCQPGVGMMTVPELLAYITTVARELGLEFPT